MVRTLLTLGLVLGLSIGITGCGGDSEPSDRQEANTSLRFGGFDNYVEITDDGSSFEEWTAEIWFRPAPLQPDGDAAQILTLTVDESVETGSGHFVHLRINPAGSEGTHLLQYMLQSASGNRRHQHRMAADTSWRHLAVTQESVSSDRSRTTIYLNGSAVVSDTASYPPVGFPFWLGAKTTNGNFFKGNLDEFRFWRTGRSREQLLRTKNRLLTGSEEKLVGYWDFNRGEKTMLLDSVGVHDGVIYGAEWSTDVPFTSTDTGE